MPRLQLTVNVNLYRLRRFKQAFDADLRRSGNGPVRRAFHEWAAIYARFLTRRWNAYSHGGGNWKPLNPVYLASKIKRGLLALILRATDLMFQSFSPDIAAKPGKISQDIDFGIRVGFGEGVQYPHSAGGPTIAQIAMYHQTGAGRLPQRKIIVPPDTAATREMRDVMQKAVEESLRS